MRSETNNAWTEGSGEDPRRPSGSDVGRYTDNSHSASQPHTRSQSRDGSGGRALTTRQSGGAPRSGRGPRSSGLRVPDASPPPRLPLKYAKERAAAAAAAGATVGGGRGRSTTSVSQEAHPSAASGSGDQGVVYEDNSEDASDYWADTQSDEEDEEVEDSADEARWRTAHQGSDEGSEEESASGELPDDGARALTFGVGEDSTETSMPAASVAAVPVETAATVTRPEAVFGAPFSRSAFRRATPAPRVGYSTGYTPGEGQTSEEKASRSKDSTEEAAKPAGVFGFPSAFTTTGSAFGAPFSSSSLSPKAAADVANPFARFTAFPMSASTAPSAPNVSAKLTEHPLTFPPTSVPFGHFPANNTPEAAPAPSASLSTSSAAAEAVKPGFGGASTPGLPFPFASTSPAASAGTTLRPSFGAAATTSQTTSTAGFFGKSTEAGGAGATQSRMTQPTKPFAFPAPQVVKSAFGPSVGAPFTGGFAPAMASDEAQRRPYFQSFDQHAFTKTQKKPNDAAPGSTPVAEAANIGKSPFAASSTSGAYPSRASSDGNAAPFFGSAASHNASDVKKMDTAARMAMQHGRTEVFSFTSSRVPDVVSPQMPLQQQPVQLSASPLAFPHRPTVGAFSTQPGSSSPQSSCVDYSTMVASPVALPSDEEEEEDSQYIQEGVDRSTAGAPAEALKGDSNVTAAAAASGARVSPFQIAAAGRSAAVESILAAATLSDGAAEDIVKAACEREQDRARAFSDVSSTPSPLAFNAASPLENSGTANDALHPVDTSLTGLKEKAKESVREEANVLTSEKAATQSSSHVVQHAGPLPVALKVTIKNVYNCTQVEADWLAEPRGAQLRPQQQHNLASATRGDGPSSSSLPTVEVALYCRPLLVHLPNPPLYTSLLSAAEKHGGLRRIYTVLRFVCGSLIPSIVYVALRMLMALLLLVICLLVLDGVSAEYPVVTLWTAHAKEYMQGIFRQLF